MGGRFHREIVATGSESPWSELAAVLVGIATSLLRNEFALLGAFVPLLADPAPAPAEA